MTDPSHLDLPVLVADYLDVLRQWRRDAAPHTLTGRLAGLEDELGAHPDVRTAARGRGTALPPRDWALFRLTAIAVGLVMLGAFAFAQYLRANDAEVQLRVCHKICTDSTQTRLTQPLSHHPEPPEHL